MILAVVLTLCTFFYIVTVFAMRKAWINTPETVLSDFIPDVSIVVVFRNEAEHLENLLTDILNLDKNDAQVEVILIDDRSEDNSKAVVENWNKTHQLNVRVEPLFARTSAHKKEGIELGLANAKNEYIAVTDADCRLPTNWLKSMITLNPHRLRCGPVCYRSKNNLWSGVLELELMGLSAMAASTIFMGKPILANAANMAYSRTLFFEVGGYLTQDRNQPPSGDDIALIKQVNAKHKSGVHFVKSANAMVQTEMPRNLKEFFNQRIRWAGKTRFDLFGIGASIHLSMVLIYLVLFITPFYLIFNFSLLLLITWTAGICAKGLADYWYFKSYLSYFKQNQLLKYLPAAEIFHLIYVVPIAILSMFVPYQWKGRKLSHG